MYDTWAEAGGSGWASGFAVDDLREIYAPPDATDHPYYQLATADWARQWPVEEIWVAHLAQ